MLRLTLHIDRMCMHYFSRHAFVTDLYPSGLEAIQINKTKNVNNSNRFPTVINHRRQQVYLIDNYSPHFHDYSVLSEC